MTEEEIYEELEITYGKPPRTTSEKNMIWLKGVLEEHIIEGEFNEDVPKPSLDALAMTLIAITTYDIPMEELAAKKPAIKRTLLWFIVKCNNHYDEIDEIMHQLMHKSYKGLKLFMITRMLKIFKWLSMQEIPTKLIEVVLHPEHYDDISEGLHQLISPNKIESAVLYIICAIEDGLLPMDVSRSLMIKEFELTPNKSAYHRYFSKYFTYAANLNEQEKKWLETQKEKRKITLRSTIGYTRKDDGSIKFLGRILTARNALLYLIAKLRRFLDLKRLIKES